MRRRELLKVTPYIGIGGGLTYIRWSDGDGGRMTDTASDERSTDASISEGRRRANPVTVEPGETETFEDPDAWDVLEGTATVAGACSKDSGETCLRLERGPERARIARRFEQPRDLTGVRPSAALAASENTYPRIQLFDVNGDELRLRAPVRGGLDYQPFNFGVETVVGEPDLSQIVEVRFNQDGSSQVWLGRLEFHAPLPPTVLIAFSGKYVSNFSDGLPNLDEHDYPATIYVQTSSIGHEDYLTVEQLEALKRDNWDVGNSTVDHADLLQLDEEGQRQQIVGGRRWLVLNDFQTGADYFAYPYSHYDQTSLDIVDRYHRLAFAGGFPATGAIPNPQLVPRSDVGGVDEAQRMIDLTARFGGVTCLFYSSFDNVGEREFRRTVEYLHEREAAGDVKVATASDLAGLQKS